MRKTGCLKMYIVLLSMVMIFILPVFSEDQASSLSEKTTEKEMLDIFNQGGQVPTLGEVALKMGASLAIVMVLIVAVIFLIRKFYP